MKETFDYEKHTQVTTRRVEKRGGGLGGWGARNRYLWKPSNGLFVTNFVRVLRDKRGNYKPSGDQNRKLKKDNFICRFQELDLSKNAYIFSDSAKEEEWYQKVKQALHPKAKYVRVSDSFIHHNRYLMVRSKMNVVKRV